MGRSIYSKSEGLRLEDDEKEILRLNRYLKENSPYNNYTIVRPAITYSKRRFQLTILEADMFIERMRSGKMVVLPEKWTKKEAYYKALGTGIVYNELNKSIEYDKIKSYIIEDNDDKYYITHITDEAVQEYNKTIYENISII